MVLGVLPSTAKSLMYPSFFRMEAMLSLIFECGNSTPGSKARFALRIRASISEMGSVIFQRIMLSVELPTGLGYARNQPIESGFAEGQTRAAELPQITVAAAAH